MAPSVGDDDMSDMQDDDDMVSLRLVSQEDIDEVLKKNETMEKIKRGQHVPIEEWPYFYITAYSISEHYGGPEEGGWYYKWYNVEETQETESYDEAAQIKMEMEVKYGLRSQEEGIGGRMVPGEMIKPHRRHSYAEYTIRIELEPGEWQSTERPGYS